MAKESGCGSNAHTPETPCRLQQHVGVLGVQGAKTSVCSHFMATFFMATTVQAQIIKLCASDNRKLISTGVLSAVQSYRSLIFLGTMPQARLMWHRKEEV